MEKKNYESPSIEVINVAIEKGFATSTGSTGGVVSGTGADYEIVFPGD